MPIKAALCGISLAVSKPTSVYDFQDKVLAWKRAEPEENRAAQETSPDLFFKHCLVRSP